MSNFNPLDYPICFVQPQRLDNVSAWVEHVPFGMLMIDLLRPNMLVELGTHTGVSYSAFCQAVKHLGLDTRCFAVDTWEGDSHSGFYGADILANLRAHHDPLYGEFSSLVQSTFDEAVKYFADGSIDLLHIDGLHTYEAVKHDFEIWVPKLSRRAVVLFHDTNVRERGFGVWKFLEELQQKYSYFEFFHGYGVGIFRVGSEITPALEQFFSMTDAQSKQVREFFFILGSRCSLQVKDKYLHEEIQTLTGQVVEREQVVQALTKQVAEREQVVQALTKQVTEREQVVQTMTMELAERDRTAQMVTEQMAEIFGSKKWKFAILLSRIRVQLVPENSIRFRVLRTLYRFIVFLIRPFHKYIMRHEETRVLDKGKVNTQKPTKIETIKPKQDDTNLSINNLDGLIQERFPFLCPLLGYEVPGSGMRLNMVTDSINSGSLFGGVGTGILLSALMAKKWGCDLRLITRTEPANKENLKKILDFNGIAYPRKIEFVFAHNSDSNAEISVKEGDIYLTTSWWTTWSVRETFGSRKIIYLLQEDERLFYPFGDERLRCSDVLSDPNIRYIVNTKLLYDHFVSDGFINIRENGLWFEPSFPRDLFYFERKPNETKKNFFFYARPNNYRNLYSLGLEVISTAVIEGVLNPFEWEFYFVGKDLPENRLSGFYNSNIVQNLDWSEYSALVRKMDLGLALMYSSHPSYPPLDLAASGSVVVTNKYGLKQNLNKYSKNIICRNLTVRGLVDGIKEGIELVKNTDLCKENYEQSGINRDWRISFEEILQKLDIGMFDVSH